MGFMKWMGAVFSPLLLGGCFLLGTGSSSQVREVPEEIKRSRPFVPPVLDRHLYGDAARLQVGQWARYREPDRIVRLAAVARDGEGTWIEEIEEGDVEKVSARLVTPQGAVVKAFYQEISPQGRTAAEPQAIQQYAPPPAPAGVVISTDTGRAAVRVGGRELQAQTVTVRREAPDGRLEEEATFWHPEVPPLYAGSAAGGLVRKESSGKLLIELLSFGSDAKPLVKPPR